MNTVTVGTSDGLDSLLLNCQLRSLRVDISNSGHNVHLVMCFILYIGWLLIGMDIIKS